MKNPNNNVLVCFLKDEFIKAKIDVSRIKAGHPVKTHGSTKYRRMEEERRKSPEQLFLSL